MKQNEVPQYSKAVNEYQQETIQAMKDIADNFLESQKEVIRSMRTLWVPYNENYKIHMRPIGYHHKVLQKIMQEQ